MRVLITSSGASAAINIIKSLRAQSDLDLEIIATDADPYAAGLRLADHFFLTPSCNSPDFIPRFLEIRKEIGPYILLPTYSKEIECFANCQEELHKNEIQTLLPPGISVQICNNKLLFSRLCEQLNIPSPSLIKLSETPEPNYPFFAKPIFGSGSDNAQVVKNHHQLATLASKSHEFLFQEYLEGQEVTVDVFSSKHCDTVIGSARLRLAVKNGQCTKSKTIDSTPFMPVIEKIVRHLELRGPSNFQFIIKNQQPYLIECNPRFAAGGLMLTVEAGLHIPLFVLKEILGTNQEIQNIQPVTGLMMSRYWQEVFWRE